MPPLRPTRGHSRGAAAPDPHRDASSQRLRRAVVASNVSETFLQVNRLPTRPQANSEVTDRFSRCLARFRGS